MQETALKTIDLAQDHVGEFLTSSTPPEISRTTGTSSPSSTRTASPENCLAGEKASSFHLWPLDLNPSAPIRIQLPNHYRPMDGCHVARPVNPSQFDLNFEFQITDFVQNL
jgi:hypothetical protein